MFWRTKNFLTKKISNFFFLEKFRNLKKFSPIKLKKVLNKFEVLTNHTNKVIIEKEFIKPEVFLFTDKFLGIPMFVSIKSKHLSFEHTHPPHTYILSQDKFKRISDLKKEINEIIN